MCGLLSGDNSVQGKAGANRGSSATQFIQSRYDPNIYIIDTMGTKDSDINISDEEILKTSLEDVHNNGVNMIKIIWTVGTETGKTDRKGPFTREAKFIGKLHISKDDGKEEKEGCSEAIWSSVMIVQKKGRPFKDKDKIEKNKKKISAILAAINDYHNGSTNEIENNLNDHYFGFTCTNYTDDFDTDNSDYEDWDTEKKERKGYYTKERARGEIMERLNKLPLYEINFRKEKCTKCGVTGDSRYVHAYCHTTKIMRHDQAISYRHPGHIQYYHTEGVEETNSGEWKYRYHPGKQRQLHTEDTEWKHPKNGKESNNFEIFQGMATSWHWHHEKWSWYYDCCNNYGKSAKGCKELYKCCGMPDGSEGCRMKYSCCGGIGNGCEEFYPCCGAIKTNKYDPVGCRPKCHNCGRDWGKPLDKTFPGGCSKTEN